MGTRCGDSCCGGPSEPPIRAQIGKPRGSTSEPRPVGCCADGGWCDDVCIELAAAYECEMSCSQSQMKESPKGCSGGSCFASEEPRIAEGSACADTHYVSHKVDKSEEAEAKEDECTKGCCSDQKDTAAASCYIDEGPEAVMEDHCNDSCCAKGPVEQIKEPVPKASETGGGCCGEDVAKVAGYCGEASSEAIPTSSETGPGSRIIEEKSVQACPSHLESAFRKYASYIEQGRCICHNVLKDVNVCCDPTRAVAGTDSYASGIDLGKGAKISSRCSNKPKDPSKTRRTDTASLRSEKSITRAPDSKGRVLQTGTLVDIEKAAARQHVSITLAGMTCTGCATKATNVLNRLEGVSDVDINFVMSMGKFRLDNSKGTADLVISRLERETGFKCTKFVEDCQNLELLMTASEAKRLEADPPHGVRSVESVRADTYKVTFDPTIIGARAVLSSTPHSRLAPPRSDNAIAEGRKKLIQMAWSTAASAALTIPVVVLAWADTGVKYNARSVASLALATIVQGIAVLVFYVAALKSLIFSRIVEMDMLIVISTTAVYGYSVIAFGLTHAGYRLEQGEFFETSSLLITLVLVGRLLTAAAKLKAVSAVSLRSLQAERALLVEESGDTAEIDARLLEFGDSIFIPPHARIVSDGEIIRGSSAVDESMLTGESIPAAKRVGDAIIAGTINGSGSMTVRLTRLPGKNSITDIASQVENALSTKPRVQALADKVASWFVPVVMAISIVVFIIRLVVAFKVQDKNGGGAVGIAITYAITVLAISCPCAVGLAVPMVLVIVGGVAARAGVIIKRSDSTERSFKVTDVVFDKTGTITKGDLHVVHEQILPGFHAHDEIESLTKTLVKDNEHPVSLAVASLFKKKRYSEVGLEQVESIPGSGIQASFKGSAVKAGNPYWLGIDRHPLVANLINQGMTLLCITRQSDLVAVYGLKSTLRDEAAAVILELQCRNITCHIVSGDGPKVVQDVSQAVGIDPTNVVSRHSPVGKQKYVKSLMAPGKVVLFCGDGTNDAVAIAQADIGVQIGAASDITRATADVVLLGGLDGIITLLELSARAYRRVVFNFAWSAVYNLFAILLAAGAFVDFRIPPAYAGLGELVSVLPVIIAPMTLMAFKRKPVAEP